MTVNDDFETFKTSFDSIRDTIASSFGAIQTDLFNLKCKLEVEGVECLKDVYQRIIILNNGLISARDHLYIMALKAGELNKASKRSSKSGKARQSSGQSEDKEDS
jgi:hypothetical protein